MDHEDDVSICYKPRVVASLTTMPDRYQKIIKTLQSLNDQDYKLDAIYLSLPIMSRRLKIPYPEPTEEMRRLCTIVPCTDYGPITKIAGGLLSEQDPNTIIITFDDDMMYPPTIVSALVDKALLYPDSAIGSSGMLLRYNCPFCAITPNEDNFLYRIPKFVVPPEGRRVDSIYGYPGALYRRGFFPSLEKLDDEFFSYALIDHNTLMNDDITISGYLSLTQIPRLIFPNMPVVSFVVSESGERERTTNEISYDIDKFFQRMNLAITKCKSIGMYAVTEPMDVTESIAGVSIIFIICLILIICAFYYIGYDFSLPSILYI